MVLLTFEIFGCARNHDKTSQNSLTKLMVSHDSLRSMVTSQIAFDLQDLESNLKFECRMDRYCQVLVSKFETLVPSLLVSSKLEELLMMTQNQTFCALVVDQVLLFMQMEIQI